MRETRASHKERYKGVIDRSVIDDTCWALCRCYLTGLGEPLDHHKRLTREGDWWNMWQMAWNVLGRVGWLGADEADSMVTWPGAIYEHVASISGQFLLRL